MVERCSVCEQSLSYSREVEQEGVEYKSCPKCSADAGVHVFYKTIDFGYRDMGDGRHIVQSWCPACRSGEKPSIPPAFKCT